METVVSKSLVRLGNSEAIVIPKRMLEQLHIAPDDRVTLQIEGDGIVARKESVPDQASARSLSELFAQHQGEAAPQEVDLGKPAGREAW